MATPQQTPVALVQELLAVHTTRTEASGKLSSANAELKGRTDAAAKQSERAIAALMNELSQFGDAVGGEVTRDNAYQAAYKTFLKEGEPATTESFETLEAALKETYAEIKTSHTDLPQSLQTLIDKQAVEIEQQPAS